jgi:hypothetical protein
MKIRKGSTWRFKEGNDMHMCHHHWHQTSRARLSPEPTASPISNHAKL